MTIPTTSRRLLLGGSAAALAGCTSHRDPLDMAEGSPYQPDEAHGVIVGSIELLSAGSIWGTPGIPATRATFERVARPSKQELASGAKRASQEDVRRIETPGGRIFDYRSSPNSYVNFFVLTLPPEPYAFGRLVVLTGSVTYSIGLPPLVVLPQPGKVLYIGALGFLLHLPTIWRQGPPLDGISLTDEADRDLPRIRQRFPRLGDQPIGPASVVSRGWAAQRLRIPT